MRRIVVVMVIFGLGLVAASAADERLPSVADLTVQTECGACHFAYQPRSCRAVHETTSLEGLDRHFGEDAGPNPLANLAAVHPYLTANAR